MTNFSNNGMSDKVAAANIETAKNITETTAEFIIRKMIKNKGLNKAAVGLRALDKGRRISFDCDLCDNGCWCINISLEEREYRGYFLRERTRMNGTDSAAGAYKALNEIIFDMVINRTEVESSIEWGWFDCAKVEDRYGYFTEAIDEAISEKMAEVSVEYQAEADEVMADYNESHNIEDLENLVKIAKNCLAKCGRISGCEMVEDDGFRVYFDELELYDIDYIEDLEDRICEMKSEMAS